VRAVLPSMIVRNSGHIVTISSLAGIIGFPHFVDYSASKAATLNFTDTLRLELNKLGANKIKFTCICPSFINTGFLSLKSFKANFLLKKIMSPILETEYEANRIVYAIL